MRAAGLWVRASHLLAALALLAGLGLVDRPAAATEIAAQAADVPGAGVLDTPAFPVRLVDRAVYQSVTRAGPRLVAGGEHGLIALSDDDGVHWRQAKVPVSATITAVAFADANIGWAIGAFGVVLRSEDGGESWALKLDGIRAACLMEIAARAQSTAPAAGDAGTAPSPAARRLRRAAGFVSDGPDKPFFVLQVLGPRTARVIGAYDMAFETGDGGSTWTPWDQRIADPRDLHPYAMVGSGAHTLLVGEQGLAAIGDPGVAMTATTLPYDGSFFGALDGRSAGMFAFGLLGHVHQSGDDGATWRPVTDPSEATVTCATLLADGTVLFGDLRGVVMRLDGHRLVPTAASVPWPLTSMVQAPDGALVLAGLGGLDVRSVGTLK